jgi:hypothetical protein
MFSDLPMFTEHAKPLGSYVMPANITVLFPCLLTDSGGIILSNLFKDVGYFDKHLFI